MSRHAASGARIDRALAEWLLPTVVLVLGPAAMVAGLMFPPATLYGPNAALGIWIPLTLILFSGVALAVQIFRGNELTTALRSTVLYLAVLLYGAVSLTWSPNAGEGVRVLLQLSVLPAVFIAAWRIHLDRRAREWVRWGATGYIGVIGLLFLTAWTTGWIPRSDLSRLMGIVTLGLPPAFVLATYALRSAKRTLLVGGGVLLIALAADARMVALVLAALLLFSPSLDVRLPVRLAGLAAAVIVVLLIVTGPRFETRWFFFDQGGSVSGVIGTVEDVIRGRLDVWTDLVNRCSETWLRGNGLGASNTWGSEVDPTFPEPHNEYVRTFCDLGAPAAGVFWLFFLVAGVRAMQRAIGQLQPSASGIAFLQLLAALLFLALTDIPLTATAQFLAPLALVLAWSEHAHTL